MKIVWLILSLVFMLHAGDDVQKSDPFKNLKPSLEMNSKLRDG